MPSSRNSKLVVTALTFCFKVIWCVVDLLSCRWQMVRDVGKVVDQSRSIKKAAALWLLCGC